MLGGEDLRVSSITPAGDCRGYSMVLTSRTRRVSGEDGCVGKLGLKVGREEMFLEICTGFEELIVEEVVEGRISVAELTDVFCEEE